MSKIARDPLYRRHRFPAEIISHAVWLYFRFPLSLRMVEDMLAARGIIVTHQTIRDWAEKFGRHFANEIRRRSAGRLGDKWYLDEVVVSVAGKKCWLCDAPLWQRGAKSPGSRPPETQLHGRSLRPFVDNFTIPAAVLRPKWHYTAGLADAFSSISTKAISASVSLMMLCSVHLGRA